MGEVQTESKSVELGDAKPVSVDCSPERFQIEFNRIGKEKTVLTGTAREYGDLGDLEIPEGERLIACASGTAGLERRAPATPLFGIK